MSSKIRASDQKASKHHPKYSDKKMLFVEAYCGPANYVQAEAARMSGYSLPAAQKLMQDDWVNQAIAKRSAEHVKQYAVEKELALRRLYHILTVDPLAVFTQSKDGGLTVKQLEAIPLDVRMCIEDIDYTKNVYGHDEDGNEQYTIRVKIKFSSKIKALELVMRHLNMLGDKTTDQGPAQVSVSVISTLLQQTKGSLESDPLTVDIKREQMLLLEGAKQ